MSSFSSLNLGARAVFAAQRGLDTTGQNIANSATPGYSRQRVDQVAVGGPTVPAIWAKYDQTGGGVKVTGISRMRDEFLEARARTAHQSLGDLAESQATYEAIERTIGEPSDSGLKQRLAEFWQSWATAGNDLKSEAPRNVVVERGKAVADELNRMSSTLEVQWNDGRVQFDARITEVNKATGDIAKLNRAIRNNIINGLPANELADQRDLLVEKVTTFTGATAEAAEDGVVNIKLGGLDLVDGARNWTLKSTGSLDAAAFRTTNPGPIDITWDKLYDKGEDITATVTVLTSSAIPTGTRSTLAAQRTALNDTLPDYLTQLDDIAVTVATTVNTQQAGSYTVTGVQQSLGAPELFVDGTAPGSLPAGARAATKIKFLGGPNDLAISTADPTPGPTAALNGNNAKDMSAKMSMVNGADDKLRALVVALGVEASSVYRNQTAAANVAKTADDAREAISGVSLNEEMTNLMKYQHSFVAAAKFITAVDRTIESLLNMTH